MLAATIGALLALWPLGDVHFRGDAHASQSVRSTDHEVGPDIERAELVLAPELALASTGRLRLTLAYRPLMLAPLDLSGNADERAGALDDQTVVLHRSLAEAVWSVPRWQLRSRASLSTGEMVLVGAGAAGSPEDPVSTTEPLRHTILETTAGMTYEPSRSVVTSLDLGYGRSGGADERARERLPVLESVRLTAAVDWRAAPRHSLGLGLAGNRSRLGESYLGDTGYLRAGGTWSFQWTERASTRTGAGLAWTYDRQDPGEPYGGRIEAVLPWFEGSVTYTAEDARPSAQIGVSVEPAVDRFRGGIDLRTGVNGRVSWTPFRRLACSGHASVSSLTSEEPPPFARPHTTVSAAGLSASHSLAEGVTLTASAGRSWQRTDRDDLPEFQEDLLMLEIAAELFLL
jgi:hypothetical protein